MTRPSNTQPRDSSVFKRSDICPDGSRERQRARYLRIYIKAANGFLGYICNVGMSDTLACIVSLQLHCIPRVSCRATREFCNQDPIIFPLSIILLPRMLLYAQNDFVSLDSIRWVIGAKGP
jgi:hypothetical protein